MDKNQPENNFPEKQPQTEDPKVVLRRLLEGNPNILQEYGLGLAKKPKKPVLKPGTVISIPQEKSEEPQEIIKVISQRKAKQILEQNGIKRTRTITEDVKKTMLENLQKGREKLKQQREEKKKEVEQQKEQVAKQSNIEVKKEIKLEKEIKNQGPTIKYVVKPKVKREFKKLENPKKFIKEEDDSEDEVSSALPTDSESEISDSTLLRKIKRNIKTIKKVDKVIEETKKPEVVKPRYNLWYS
jgi:hypothetical protein